MSEVTVTCPECSSENVMFSKKRQVYVCEDCGHIFTVETPFVPKRVFISYGHDDHAALAMKLRDDLKTEGHEAWFDLDRLKPGGDWEQYIEEGLAWAAADKANGAVALLMTPHSVRRPEGYCLNEVARALNLGLRIIPMMVVDSEPPLSICRIQWLDLRPCIPISQKEALYQPRFERFLEALMNPTLDLEGNQQRLLKALQPLDFDADILFHLKSFVGRDWVFKKIDAWLACSASQRVFWIAGAPGVGKTAICAWLSSRYLEIGAMHLCKFGHRQKGDPAKVVASLAYQLTTQLPAYEAALLAKDIGALALDDARTMFDNLIVQPLSKLSTPKRPIALLIDALDEATHDGQNALAGFIAAEFPKTPDWLRLIITSRPEPEVTGPLQRLTPFVLDTACQDNINDIKDYINQQLKSELSNRPDADAIVQTILDRSEYVFLYVQRVCQDVLEGALSLDAMDQFPKGLGEAFWLFFERQFGNTDDDKTRLDRYKDRTRSALRAILAAREPLPVAVLQGLFNWQDEELNDFIIALGSLFPVFGVKGAACIKPYHKAIADWLGDKEKSKGYYVSLEEGARLLANHGWHEYKKGQRTLHPYFLCHLPSHLASVRQWTNLENLMSDKKFLKRRLKKGMVFIIVEELHMMVKMQRPLDRFASTFVEEFRGFPFETYRQQLRSALNQFFGLYSEWPEVLRKCLEESNDVNLVLFLGDALDMEERFDEEEHLYLRFLERNGTANGNLFATACARLAFVREHKDSLYEGIAITDMFNSEPNIQQRCDSLHYYWVQFHRAVLLRRLYRYDEAISLLERVYEAGTSSGQMISALHSLGINELELGHWDRAEEIFKQCLQERGTEGWDHRRAYEYRRLAQVYAIRNRVKDAHEAFSQALDISSNCGNEKYVKEIHTDIKLFLDIPDSIAADNPNSLVLKELATVHDVNESMLSASFTVLEHRGLFYLPVVSAETGDQTGEVVPWSSAHGEGYWHATVLVLVIDVEGRLALQVREEPDSRGKMDVSVSGHQAVDETDIVCAIREASEELGIVIGAAKLRRLFDPYKLVKEGNPDIRNDEHKTPYHYLYKTEKVNRERTSVFLVKDERQIERVPPTDTMRIHWIPFDEAVDMANKKPEGFASGFKQLLHPVVVSQIKDMISK